MPLTVPSHTNKPAVERNELLNDVLVMFPHLPVLQQTKRSQRLLQPRNACPVVRHTLVLVRNRKTLKELLT